MISNDGIRIQRKITRRTGFFSISNNVWRNIRDHNKKENEKKNITNHRDKINNKKRRTRKSRTRISKETMNISGRQE